MIARALRCVLVLSLAIAGCGDGGGDASGDIPDAAEDDVPDAVDPGPDEAALILGVAETGGWTVPGLEADVQVIRTAGDVPHVYASSLHDLMVAEGFLMARDRYFSFEVVHRIARGQATALLGDLALGIDVDLRTQGLHVVAQRLLDALDEEGGALFDAYAKGINAWLEAAAAGEVPLPGELELFGPILGAEDPLALLSPVGRTEVAAFAAFVVFNSAHETSDLVRDAAAAHVAGHFDGAALGALRQAGLEQDLLGSDAPVHPVSTEGDDPIGTRAGGLGAPPARAGAARRPPVVAPSLPLPASLRDALAARHARHQRLLGRGDTGDHGSNVWAVSGAVTADGQTLVAGDGHLALGVPPYFMQMGLDDTVFGDGELRVSGLFLPGFPLLAVGTNGRVAWSQTYPRADVVDWYREELQLGADGLPADSRFDGAWVPLVRVDESYTIKGVLTGEDRVETWPRWETFDGRLITDLEGTPADATTPGVVATGAGFVLPGDVDGDGVVVAISTDYTAYDSGDLLRSIRGFVHADDVVEWRENVRRFVGYAQNLITGDVHGGTQYTGYTTLPCRGYLERDADGHWLAGADPDRILDGTTYGGFQILLDDDGLPLHAGDTASPTHCTIPFEDWPAVIDPPRGYVMNANNDPDGRTFDGTLANDPWHIGGPWVPGYRALTIDEALAEQAADGSADVASMAALQADHTSQVGRMFAPMLLEGLAWGLAQGVDPAAQATLEEVQARIEAWLASGAPAESGVATFYHQPTAEQRDHAVATMIFNGWFRAWRAAVLDDEVMSFAFTPAGWARTLVTRTLHELVDGRGPDNPRGLASWNADTEESAFFDVLGTPEVETSGQVAFEALETALAVLAGPDQGPAAGGFETADMDQWLWGLRHQLVLESILLSVVGADVPLLPLLAEEFSIDTGVLPLAESFPDGDPRAGLQWFPRAGDLFNVDAASPSFAGDDYHYANGPIMRMVVSIGPDGVSGLNVVPGGQSGIHTSPHFADQAALWLGNEALPLLFAVEDVVAAAVGREVLRP